MSNTKYSKQLDSIKLEKISFSEINAKLFPENFGDGGISVEVKNTVEIQKEENDTFFAGIDSFTILCVLSNKTVAEINLKAVAIFTFTNEIDNEFLELFRKNTLKLITYPFVRETVNSLSYKLGLPPLVLPIWKQIVPTKGEANVNVDLE